MSAGPAPRYNRPISPRSLPNFLNTYHIRMNLIISLFLLAGQRANSYDSWVESPISEPCRSANSPRFNLLCSSIQLFMASQARNSMFITSPLYNQSNISSSHPARPPQFSCFIKSQLTIYTRRAAPHRLVTFLQPSQTRFNIPECRGGFSRPPCRTLVPCLTTGCRRLRP